MRKILAFALGSF